MGGKACRIEIYNERLAICLEQPDVTIEEAEQVAREMMDQYASTGSLCDCVGGKCLVNDIGRLNGGVNDYHD